MFGNFVFSYYYFASGIDKFNGYYAAGCPK